MVHRRRSMLKSLVASASIFFGLQAQAGIEEPEKIDAVANKPDSPYVVLLMASNLAWNEKTLAMLEKKLAHYVHFVKSGQLVQGRPTAQGKKVRIVLVHEVTPDEAHKLQLLELRGKTESEGIQLVWGGKSEVLALASAP